ncbi:MAG: CapA family protein [Vallitaleaceae bacterium]|nr:CapA family protein [Vallitaleaceae bacterium]
MKNSIYLTILLLGLSILLNGSQSYSRSQTSEAIFQSPTIKTGIPGSYIRSMAKRIQVLKSASLKQQRFEKRSPKNFSITISAVGDCTLGTDESFTYPGSFTESFDENEGNYSYFMKNVQKIFKEDDLTLGNLETPLTSSTQKVEKQFRFKGDPSYVNILKQGSIEAVNLANNHANDYLKTGYNDTLKVLREASIGLFGVNQVYITRIKGVKIGVLGYTGWSSSPSAQEKIRQNVADLKRHKCQLVIVFFHWGEERINYPNQTQKILGHLAIDSGADLVVGCHPHVVQGIENYEGKYIVYSLGNFCFGGNENPSDKDTFIFQQTFYFTDLIQSKPSEISIIPCSISSDPNRNNYQPTPLMGNEYDRVLGRINEYSRQLNFLYRDDLNKP